MVNDLHCNDLRNITSCLVLRIASQIDTIVTAKHVIDNRKEISWDEAKTTPSGKPQAFFSGGFFDPVEPDTIIQNGVAVLRVNGLIRPETPWWASTAGLEELISETERLKNDIDVSRTVVRITSNGGFPERLEDWRAAVAEHSKVKPIDAFITDAGLSGGFWLASPCDTVWCDPTALVGALGVFAILCDDSKLLEEMGIFCTLVSDNKEGVKGHSSMPDVSNREIDETLRSIKEASKLFRKAVQEGRGFSDEEIKNLFTGQVWTGEVAKGLGLVDGVRPWFQYLASLTGGNGLETTSTGKDKEMSDENGRDEEKVFGNALIKFVSEHWPVGKKAKEPRLLPAVSIVPSITGDKYMHRAATGELRSYVSSRLGKVNLTPGVLNTDGFMSVLCMNLSFSVIGDRGKKNADLVKSCPTMYDVAESCDWDDHRMLATVISMLEVSNPFESLMAAFEAVPKFIAATNPSIFRNMASGNEEESKNAPSGGGIETALERPPQKSFDSLTDGAQAVLTELSGGEIKDEKSYQDRVKNM